VAEAVTLIDQAEERRPVAERQRPETLRGLPRTMKEYGTDQVRGVLPNRLRQRHQQPPAAVDPLAHVWRSRLAEHVAKRTVAEQRAQLVRERRECLHTGALDTSPKHCHQSPLSTKARGPAGLRQAMTMPVGVALHRPRIYPHPHVHT
jgi:hypothetical protein